MSERVVFSNSRVDVVHICYDDTRTGVVTGKTGSDFDTVLYFKLPAGSVFVEASESVSFDGEIIVGSINGRYGFSFTPLSAGTYVLHVINTAASTDPVVGEFEFTAMSSGAAFSASYSDAFCSEADVEDQVGLTFDASSIPNSTQVAGYSRLIAAELQGILIQAGLTVTPDGGSDPIDTTGVLGSTFRDLMRYANAVGAGFHAADTAYSGVAPERSSKATDLEDLYSELKDLVVDMGEKYNDDGLIKTPYTDEDEIDQPTVASGAEASGIKFPLESDAL